MSFDRPTPDEPTQRFRPDVTQRHRGMARAKPTIGEMIEEEVGLQGQEAPAPLHPEDFEQPALEGFQPYAEARQARQAEVQEAYDRSRERLDLVQLDPTDRAAVAEMAKRFVNATLGTEAERKELETHLGLTPGTLAMNAGVLAEAMCGDVAAAARELRRHGSTRSPAQEAEHLRAVFQTRAKTLR